MLISVLQKILDYKLWGNEGLEYLNAFGVFLALALVFFLIQKILLNRARRITEKTKTDIDDFLLKVFQNIKPPFYIIFSLYISARFLILSNLVEKIIYGIFIIAVIAQLILILQKVIDYAVSKRVMMLNGENGEEETITKIISQIIKFTLWIIGALLVLSNLGVDVTSLVAGFGIGGIAIAFAAQNLLGDVFASFSIFIDKPFKVGDNIKTGTDSGEVKRIGIKTTRIKTLAGNELIIPNKDLTDSRIHNFKRIGKRRISFNLGITYDAGTDKLKRMPKIIEEIINGVNKAKLSRIHFRKFGESSLIFNVVYFADTKKFKEHLDIRQEINLKIYEQFEKEGIKFAYPTQTVLLNKEQ